MHFYIEEKEFLDQLEEIQDKKVGIGSRNSNVAMHPNDEVTCIASMRGYIHEIISLT